MWTLFRYTTTTTSRAGGASLAPDATETQTRDLKAHPGVLILLPLALAAIPPLLNWLANTTIEGSRHDNAVQLACANRALASGPAGLPAFCRLPSPPP